ncbi:MAG: TIGR03620 family F420-dependent LLM class oxidoreductase [Armatimonadetes bacterium]|nr:TIGR03620 family F420-dependent LLM class oxidoreductase [Armatimonadota bacterium]
MEIGKLGVFYFTDGFTAAQAAGFARKVERLGYGALWYPEALGRETMAHASWLLANTERLVIASGIANIFARDPQATAAASLALSEQSNSRYLLGLGVSHAPLVRDVRGHAYHKPLQRMREYLQNMGRAVYRAPRPSEDSEVVLAALGPKMLELAGAMTDGAHPYNVTPEHTAFARGILGPEKRLYVEQKVMLETDPTRARAAARQALDFYLAAENYRNNWKRLGFGDGEIDGPSDRFLDAMVAWGDADALRRRIQEHWDAGADHVCIQPVGDVDRVLEALGPNQ